MKVLVTGVTSLLGGAVAARLRARGDDVVALQRGEVDLTALVPPPGGSVDEPGDVHVVRADIRDADAVAAAAAGCDAVVHLAAKVGVVGDPAEYQAVNVDGTANVLEAARSAGAARFVHVSSPSVAHTGAAIVGAGADPAVTGRRHAPYAETKALGERLAMSADGDRLAVVVLRPHLVWGPGDTQLVGRIVERASAGRLALVGGGTALVDTTFLDNAADAHVAALDAVRPGARCAGRAYVIADGHPWPIRDLVLGICRAAGIEVSPRSVPRSVARGVGTVVERAWPAVRDDEPPLTRFLAEQLGTAHWFDPRPARDDLGWSPSVTTEEGLRRLGEWFSAQD